MGGLVFAEAEERRVAQAVVGGPFGEADLRDEARLEPGRAGQGREVGEGRRGADEGIEAAAQIGQDRVGEARPHAPGVAQPRCLVDADEQGAEVGARALGAREPADDELLLVAQLDLLPGRRAQAGQVARRRILGDDALQAQAPRAGQGAPPVGAEAAGEPQDGGFADLALEDGAALGERLVPQIVARARRGSRRPRRPRRGPASPWSSAKRETARVSKTTASPSRTRVGAGSAATAAAIAANRSVRSIRLRVRRVTREPSL